MTGSPSNVAFDGKNIWVPRSDAGTIVRLAPTNGAYRGGISGTCAYNIIFDGTSLWVANFYCNTVSKISKSQQ
jgi:hypothetical protein